MYGWRSGPELAKIQRIQRIAFATACDVSRAFVSNRLVGF
jgi:hypothetical protein